MIDPELDIDIQQMLDDWNSDDELNEFAEISVQEEVTRTYSGGGFCEVMLRIFEYAIAGFVVDVAKDVIKDAAKDVVVDKSKALISALSAKVKKCVEKQNKGIEIQQEQDGRHTVLIIRKK